MTIGIAVMLLLAFSLVLFFLFSQRKLHNEQLKSQAAELRHQEELVQHNLTTQEEERRRIAINLHDEIGSKLGVLNLTIHRLRRILPEGADHEGIFDEINGVIAGTMESTRRISHGLLPPTLEDFGLIDALAELCETIKRTGVVDIKFDCELQRSDIGDKTVELNVFRIVQELTSNTLKYSRANQVTITLKKVGDKRQLIYTDNGAGFNLDSLSGRGLGMQNLASRAKIIHGDFNIRTSVGEGFELSLLF